MKGYVLLQADVIKRAILNYDNAEEEAMQGRIAAIDSIELTWWDKLCKRTKRDKYWALDMYMHRQHTDPYIHWLEWGCSRNKLEELSLMDTGHGVMVGEELCSFLVRWGE